MGVLGTHDTECRDFSADDAAFVQSVANVLATAVERRAHERDLERKHEELAALDTLNHVVRDIADAALQQSSREEVERLVCERLADTDSFAFAWIGELDDGEVVTRVEAGVDGYLDGVSLPVTDGDGRAEGPTPRAIRTREVQVTRDVENDPSYEAWRDHARRYGFRSSAAVPIVHEELLYGVLNVYSEREAGFGEHEREVLGHLGHIAGHAINAIEQRRALIGDEIVEVTFRLPDYLDDVPEATGEGAIHFERLVPTGGDAFVSYGTASAAAVDDLHAYAAHSEFADSLRIVETSDEGVHFELELDEPPVATTVADQNGRVRDVTIEEGDLEFAVELPAGDHVRPTVEAIESAFPSMEVVAQRQERRDDPDHRLGATLTEELTDRQRAVLEAAYFGGYFEWPRSIDGEELAASMNVSSPTVHQHLRTAQRKLLRAVFDDEGRN
ncbi:bacterio-opsin activator domain-containing protein [Halospeciosus flavus]|uniref:bacterio-opsin activator domain-containing protein n=1 Tax=Halospeciosus flavus TaxID=3032283 RepID=UPI003607C1D3